MRRIFYSDYGEDAGRIARAEKIIRHLKSDGNTVCRTSRYPLDTSALNLIMPNMIERPTKASGLALHAEANTNDPVVSLAAAAFHYDHPKKNLVECYASIYIYQQFIEAELDRFAPDLVILWHQFNPYHYVIANWCQRKEIPVLYGEHGVLPGSWCFEYGGQMAESWIARNPKRFAELPITDTDLERAETYLDHVVRHRMNRKSGMTPLSETGLDKVLAADPRPKILYAGVNDYKTGLMPYSSSRTLLHAGDFINSELGLEAILPHAHKLGWHVIYKPHPSVKHKTENYRYYSNCLTVISGKVDLLDLLPCVDTLATIVSQSAYMSLFHGVPTVLMGRMQLTGSGLVHEALFQRGLVPAFQAALAKKTAGLKVRERLRQHVARLIRYYVISAKYNDRGLFCSDLSDFAAALSSEQKAGSAV